MNKSVKDALDDNMIFVGTIYDSFEALEETLGKLKLERPLFLTYLAKMAFAEEVFKRAYDTSKFSTINPPKMMPKGKSISRIYN